MYLIFFIEHSPFIFSLSLSFFSLNLFLMPCLLVLGVLAKSNKLNERQIAKYLFGWLFKNSLNAKLALRFS